MRNTRQHRNFGVHFKVHDFGWNSCGTPPPSCSISLTCACDVLEADTVKYTNRNSTDSAYRDLLRRFFLETELPMVADSRSLKRKVLIDAFSSNN